ncbi:pantoate--beta-alanine ligase [Nocardioidaceae bacterium]|nr:pantoate--beta-alanine ligase [Nocardioidaceae bacterium]
MSADVLRRPGVATTREELAQTVATARAGGATVALVPTMGALHEGHLALVDAARDRVGEHGFVVVSVFVNPLQFGPGEDLDAYPRTLEADVDACAEHGVDLVWTPSEQDVYPDPAAGIAVEPGPLGAELEGAVRPTHFRGVLTVVATLLGVVGPDVLVMGEKDYQQLVLVRSMVRNLALDVEVVGVATDREHDGLARSSRNRYLDGAQRDLAAALPRALAAGAAAAERGGAAVVAEAHEALDVAGVSVDYVALRTPDLRADAGHDAAGGEARLLVAARVGATRLIDNRVVQLPAAPAPTSGARPTRDQPQDQENPCFAP